MARLSSALLLAAAGVLCAIAAQAFDCSFSDSYPRQYVAYRLSPDQDIVIDGALDDEAWTEVPWTENFVDINTTTTPMLATRAKIRYDSTYLYVGAFMEEPHVWANITSTCHCLNPNQDQVIFHDNDFEIFVDADGSTHNYKEYEMNAANATWDLLLDRPYNDGGSENSTRVYGSKGWDMQPPLHCKTALHGPSCVLSNTRSACTGWSVEVALPLHKLADNKPDVQVPPRGGAFWRINFSRVEWHVDIVNGSYIKNPSCQSCPVPGAPNEDNWVWSHMGQIDMHLPEKWGMLQFSEEPVNTTAPVRNPEWPVRSVAAAVYYAQHAFADAHNGTYARTVKELLPYAQPDEGGVHALDGTCTHPINLWVADHGKEFLASATERDGSYTAFITDSRLLTVRQA